MADELKIKFSHDYVKLGPQWQGKFAFLLSARVLDNLLEIPNYILHWDTLYYEAGEEKHYPLDLHKPHLMLNFAILNQINQRVPLFFTTFRSAYPQSKIDYYLENQSQRFELVKI